MEVTTNINTSNMLSSNYDASEVFLGCNTFEEALFTNGTGVALDLPAGKLMGRIAATDKAAILTSAAVDGSQFPLGINASPMTVAIGATVTLSLCVSGNVAENKVILAGADTLETIISLRRIKDRIAADTVGIKLLPGTDLTGYDN